MRKHKKFELSENSNLNFSLKIHFFRLLSIYYCYYMHCYCSSKCKANNHHIIYTTDIIHANWLVGNENFAMHSRTLRNRMKGTFSNSLHGNNRTKSKLQLLREDKAKLCECTFSFLIVSFFFSVEFSSFDCSKRRMWERRWKKQSNRIHLTIKQWAFRTNFMHLHFANFERIVPFPIVR